MRIAVCGAGISGLSAAWLLSRAHEVDVYERHDRLGGHAHTSHVHLEDGVCPLDTGFMVYNYRTYPHLTRLFARLGVVEHDADMSFSVRCAADDLEWSGSLAGILARPANLLRPDFLRMLIDVLRMSASAERLLREARDDMNLGRLLDTERMGQGFRRWYFVPMASAIWSSRPADMLSYPAATFLRFMDNHGLLHIRGKPQWKSLVGGSRTYVDALAADISGDVRTGQPIEGVQRYPDRVEISTSDSRECYDACILAMHADDALTALHNPSAEEREILGAFRFQENPTVVHHDVSLLPRAPTNHAAWNYFAETDRIEADTLSVTYYLNRLQKLPTDLPVFATLNPVDEPTPDLALFKTSYRHPVFDTAALAAQRRIGVIQGVRRTWYCGAWQRYGFHEDGIWSAVNVAESLGVRTPWAEELGSAGISQGAS